MTIKKEMEKSREKIDGISNNQIKSNLRNASKSVERTGENIFIKLSKKSGHKRSKLTFGQKTADGLAKWAGSWFFIIIFFIFITSWIATSGYFFLKYFDQIDEYPFIILNLILSCLAAIQAPVILMSQNRSAQRDRIRAEYDYEVNRKAEKEIREIKEQLNRIEKNIR